MYLCRWIGCGTTLMVWMMKEVPEVGRVCHPRCRYVSPLHLRNVKDSILAAVFAVDEATIRTAPPSAPIWQSRTRAANRTTFMPGAFTSSVRAFSRALRAIQSWMGTRMLLRAAFASRSWTWQVVAAARRRNVPNNQIRPEGWVKLTRTPTCQSLALLFFFSCTAKS